MTGVAERVGRVLGRAAGVEPEPLTWRVTDGPWFDNQVAMLDLDGRHATFRLERVVGGDDGAPKLEEVAARPLA